MAKKNDSLHPIFIILAFFAFIIIKTIEFIIANKIIIFIVLGLTLGVLLVYYILNHRKKVKTKKEKKKISDQRMNIPFNSKVINVKPKIMGSDKLITEINENRIQTIKSQINKNFSDETIIDIKNEVLDLSIEDKGIISRTQLEVPTWSHSYVYSYDEIKYASNQQKKFYFHLRENLLKGKLIDIQGNTNYAFILYFDLLNEYRNHKKIKLLEEQFELIGQICPKTKNYTLQILIDELKKRSDTYSIEKLKELENPLFRFENGYTDYNPYQYKLGSLFKDKLKLDKKDVERLNKIYHSSNVFLSIENCLIEVIKQNIALY